MVHNCNYDIEIVIITKWESIILVYIDEQHINISHTTSQHVHQIKVLRNNECVYSYTPLNKHHETSLYNKF